MEMMAIVESSSPKKSVRRKKVGPRKKFNTDVDFIQEVTCKILRDKTITLSEYNFTQCNTEYATLSNVYLCTVKFNNPRWPFIEYNAEFILKSEPIDRPILLDIYRNEGLFQNEIFMYYSVLEKMYKLTGKRFGPKLIYCSTNSKIIIIDSLNFFGFRMLDRWNGLPKDYCNYAIKKLAVFHAASVALCEKNPNWPNMLHGGWLYNPSDSFLNLCENSIRNVSREISSWGKEFLVISYKLNKIIKEIRTMGKQIYDHDLNEFCVINHGDLNIDNMLFSHYDDLPYNVLFIDYKRSCYTSPVIDLIHFFVMCPEISLRYKKDYKFLPTYLELLSTSMDIYNCKTKPPTLKEIENAIRKRRLYIIIVGLVLYPRMIANKNNEETLEEVLGNLNGNTKLDVFKEPLVVESIRKFIKVMELRGIFD
ncbi:hypothetical protein M0802_008463 [Mischocyttarus mexicanus]|nr:hypothetical protein M0802_008463 [Mischocyttarus mexicanus]